MAEDDEEYKLHALGLKDKGISGSLYSAIVSWMYAGNEAFQEGDMQSAIELYSQVSVILYSIYCIPYSGHVHEIRELIC